MANTDEQWREWGKSDPYFAVYTDEKFKKKTVGDHRQDFFATGERSISNYLTEAYRAFGEPVNGRALDFGCGVGRLTIPLAKRYRRVVGVDISPDMLDEARRNFSTMGMTNAEFVNSDDTLSTVQDSFDLVLSYIVLQHIPINRGMALIRQLLSRVGPGGLIIIQVSAKRQGGHVQAVAYWIRHNVPQLAAAYRFLQGRGWSKLSMRMTEYDIVAVLRLFSEYGMNSVLVSEHFQGDILTYRLISRLITQPTTGVWPTTSSERL